jgi:hypothetical protein
MILLAGYIVLSLATFIDLNLTLKNIKLIRAYAPTKNRSKLNDEIDQLQHLKKYSAIWPYVVYKLIKS